MKRVPSYQSLMFPTALALKKLGGQASNDQVGYIVMCGLNLPHKLVNRAFKVMSWSATYLRRIGIFEEKEKKGIWKLKSEYMQMPEEELNQLIRTRYKKLYNE